MYSYWKKTFTVPALPSPSDLSSVDVAVIGGGLCGILCAHFLQEAGFSVLVLEAEHVGSGQTGNTTAKITSQHGLCYDRLLRHNGPDMASLYANAHEEAIDSYERLIRDHKISCHFRRLPSYLYTNQSPHLIQKEWQAARRSGLSAHLTTSTELPFSVSLALRFNRQAQFHPLRFLAALADHIPVSENTRVLDVEENRLITSRGCISAKNIVFACHYPFINFPGLYFLRMHQDRSYCLAVKHVSSLNGMYLGIDKNSLSLRSYGHTLIIGGNSHRCGENSKGGRYRMLYEAAKKYWPGGTPVIRWSAQDCITLDGLPYIGRFSSDTPSWYIGTGFAKWGMTSSMVAARLITDLICEKSSPLEKLFSPQRPFSRYCLPSLSSETGHAVKGLSRSLFPFFHASLSSLPPGHGGIIDVHGRQVGAYRRSDGKLFMIDPRCPHLGCRLEWNPDEHSWDCPCHGSRFSYDGSLISGPSTTSLSKIRPSEAKSSPKNSR